jgi:hypothetical protein
VKRPQDRRQKSNREKAQMAQGGKPQPKNLNRSKQRKQRKKNFAKNAQFSGIALHAFSQRSLGKSV